MPRLKFGLRWIFACTLLFCAIAGMARNKIVASIREREAVSDLVDLRGTHRTRTHFDDLGYGIAQRLGYSQVYDRVCELDLSDTLASDSQVASLALFEELRTVNLKNTRITDATVSALTTSTKIISLDLSRTNITDACAHSLAKLTSLQHIDLSDTAVTDQILKTLGSLPQLSSIQTGNTAVTMSAVAECFPLTALQSNVKDRYHEMGFYGGSMEAPIFWLRTEASVCIMQDAVWALRKDPCASFSLGVLPGLLDQQETIQLADSPVVVAINDVTQDGDGFYKLRELRHAAISELE